MERRIILKNVSIKNTSYLDKKSFSGGKNAGKTFAKFTMMLTKANPNYKPYGEEISCDAFEIFILYTADVTKLDAIQKSTEVMDHMFDIDAKYQIWGSTVSKDKNTGNPVYHVTIAIDLDEAGNSVTVCESQQDVKDNMCDFWGSCKPCPI